MTVAQAPASELESAWLAQARWSEAANRAKASFVRWQRVAVCLTVGAAVATTAASQLPASCDVARRVLSFGAGLAVALLALVGRNWTSPARMREWIRARSVSEGLKSQTYLYVTRSGRYRKGDADDAFAEQHATTVNGAADLTRLTADVTPAAKPVPPNPMPITDYFQQRVDGQIQKFYRPKARSEATLVSRYRKAEFVLAALATAIAVHASASGATPLAAWGAVITTTLATLAAHLAAGRHEYQLTTYTATWLELERLSARFKDKSAKGALDADALDTLVVQAEAAISVENQGWMAQWKEPNS